jgi:hypothetical protein
VLRASHPCPHNTSLHHKLEKAEERTEQGVYTLLLDFRHIREGVGGAWCGIRLWGAEAGFWKLGQVWEMGMKAVTVAEPPQPVVICGPSGVGKGTLIGKLMKDHPDKFGFSVSHTTRSPRVREIDGVHYHFASRPVMAQEIKEGKFLESAEVHGNLYGTSLAAVQAVADAGKV